MNFDEALDRVLDQALGETPVVQKGELIRIFDGRGKSATYKVLEIEPATTGTVRLTLGFPDE